MSLEERLRDHFDTAAHRLPDPGDSLANVSRRGRRRGAVKATAITLSIVLLLVGVPLTWRALEEVTVELGPAAPPPEREDPEAEPTLSPDEEAVRAESVAPGDLRAPVLAYGPYEHDQLERIDREGTQVLWSGSVDAAFSDGRGGAVVAPASEPAVVWLPHGDDTQQVTLAEADDKLILRGLLPDGRVLYSVPPDEATLSEDDAEEFFAVALAGGAQSEHVESTRAYERRVVGPAAAADRQLVHVSCHVHCSLWLGLAEASDRTDATPSRLGPMALYHGGGDPAGPTAAIDGLTATPDGRLVGFIEHDPNLHERAVEVVLLDGTSFDELARVQLPWEAGVPVGAPVVSLSTDGQRVLVALGSAAPSPTTTPPTTPFVVDDALTEDPQVRRVDFTGALRWVDPVAAAGLGGPVTAEEHVVAERFAAFAGDPHIETFEETPFAAEVRLGLGPQLIGPARRAPELADPAAWQLHPDEPFRATVLCHALSTGLQGHGHGDRSGCRPAANEWF